MSRMGFSPPLQLRRMKVAHVPIEKWRQRPCHRAHGQRSRLSASFPPGYGRDRDARGSEPLAGVSKLYIPEPNYVPLEAAAGSPKPFRLLPDIRKRPECLAPSTLRALGTRVANGGVKEE